MGHEKAPRLTVVQPGEGREGTLGSIGVVFKLGLPDPAVIEKLASDYGLYFAEAPWLPDIIARYNLTPPPG